MFVPIIAIILLGGVAVADVKQFNWKITKEQVPIPNTGTKREMMLIDKTWPPNPVIVDKGDVLKVNVLNLMDEKTSLHAHGFLQKDNNFYDGPEGITQCGIFPGQAFQYEWHATESGTFWIHSHHPAQYPHGLRFPLIVKDTKGSPSEPTTYAYGAAAEKDIVIDMADTYYLQDQKDVDDDYKNGKCGKGLEPPPTGIVHKDYMGTDGINTIYAGGPSGRLRIRFINMSAFSTMLIFLNNGETKDGTAQGIPFRVSEVDSVPLDRDYMPIAKAIELNAGQRMSIIVDLDNDLGNDKAGFNVITTMNPHHIATNKCADVVKDNYAYTSKSYIHFTDPASGATPPPAPVMTFSRPPRYPASPSAYDNTRIWVNSQWKLDNIPIWADKNASPNTVVTETWYLNKFIPAKKVPRIAFNGEGSMPTKFLSVDFTATTGPGGSKEFATLNEKTFVAPGSPVLLQAMRPLPPSCPNSPLLLGIGMPKPVNTNTLGPEPYYANNPGQGNVVENTITVEQGQTIYMLLKAHVGSHTFHLHGHDFQVLYTQPENESSHELAVPDIELLKNNGLSQPASPMRRDTLFVTTKTVALIAFTADNPGAWFFHCHNDYHALSGMSGVIVVNPPGGFDKGLLRERWGDAAYEQCGGNTNGFPVNLSAWRRECINNGR